MVWYEVSPIPQLKEVVRTMLVELHRTRPQYCRASPRHVSDLWQSSRYEEAFEAVIVRCVSYAAQGLGPWDGLLAFLGWMFSKCLASRKDVVQAPLPTFSTADCGMCRIQQASRLSPEAEPSPRQITRWSIRCFCWEGFGKWLVHQTTPPKSKLPACVRNRTISPSESFHRKSGGRVSSRMLRRTQRYRTCLLVVLRCFVREVRIRWSRAFSPWSVPSRRFQSRQELLTQHLWRLPTKMQNYMWVEIDLKRFRRSYVPKHWTASRPGGLNRADVRRWVLKWCVQQDWCRESPKTYQESPNSSTFRWGCPTDKIWAWKIQKDKKWWGFRKVWQSVGHVDELGD